MGQNIAVIGECMLELSRQSPASTGHSIPMNLSYGGDTLNTAVYLARQGIAVDYVTSLGDDPMSIWMVDQWRSEGIGCSLVDYLPDALPGLYLIETDEKGERSFFYWRDNAPARRLLENQVTAEQLFSQLSNHAWLYLSGITLAIYSEVSRQRLFNLLAAYRDEGGRVIFDGNYRPKLWPDLDTTVQAYEAMYRVTDLALPTLEDEQKVFGDSDEHAVIARLQSYGVSETALKMGDRGCLSVLGQVLELVPSQKVTVVDTTSAGDSFNAGFLAARLRGATPSQAAQAGHRLASAVIQHRGAIIPVAAMP